MPEKPTDIVTDVTHYRKAGRCMCVTVPKRVRTAVNWAEGQPILMRIHDNRIELEPLVEHMAQAIQKYEQEHEPRN